MTRTRVFVLCAAADAGYLAELRTQLAGAGDAVELWDESCIEPGARRQDEIDAVLETASIALLFVSPDLLASADATARDLPALARRMDAEQVRVLCLHARPSLGGRPLLLSELHRRFAALQPLNDPARPLSTLTRPERETMLATVAEQILRIACGEGDDDTTDAERHAYLHALVHEFRYLDVRGIGAKKAERIELERVYTLLRATGPAAAAHAGQGDPQAGRKSGERMGEAAHERDLELAELLSRHTHVVLIGDPGAGKTTFLRFVALNLSRAVLDDEREACLQRIGLGDLAPAGVRLPLPIFVRLGSFGQFLNEHPAGDYAPTAPEHFLRYLDHLCRGRPVRSRAFLRQSLAAGACLLLLDGLDEVPGQETRERVGAIIDQVVAEERARGHRYLVTCRTRAYQGRAQLSAHFASARLLDFGSAEIDAFVTQWSQVLFRARSDAPESGEARQAEAHRTELLEAIRAHPHVQPLTANPLLLTILAVVHWNEKKLPEQRADLYAAAIKYLLETRDKQSPHPATLRLECLQRIALRLFDDARGVRRTLGRAEAADAVIPILRVEAAQAAAFVEDEELHSGILVSRLDGEVEFWHPTFAEYLAALGLAAGSDCWERLRAHVFDERWAEVVLLVAGCLRQRGLRPASDFIRNVLESEAAAQRSGWWGLLRDLLRRDRGARLAAHARAVGLVGRILRDILPAGGDPAAETGYAAALREVLAAFEPGSTVPESVRVEVGEALGQAGDPRFHDDDHEDRVFIEGGTFLMGADDITEDERPVQRVTVSSFWIDRYPVTVERYGRFLDAHADHAPRAWEEQQRHPNRPVTRVTWHQAQAYCAWLSARSGRRVVLPTEAQWEYAARGKAGRKYPWGGAAPTEWHMNFRNRVGHPTPVGIYPLGATPEGAQDMAGNVVEWCSDAWGAVSVYVIVLEAEKRVLRGGGFHNVAWLCRAACRQFSLPESDGDSIGFRCVVWASGGQND